MVANEFLLAPGTPPDDWDQPLAFVDLAQWPDASALPSSPPFPIIGLGDRRHPIAATLDAVIESPVSADMLIREISANPLAAAVTVQLLRAIETASLESALVLESLAYGLLQGSEEHAAWAARQTVFGGAAGPGKVAIARQEDVLSIVIDRPDARNAIDRPIRDSLFEAFTLAALDRDIRSVRLRSTGPAFSIGADLTEFGTTRDPATAHWIRGRTLPAHAILGCADRLDVHVQGACIGAGLEIAAFARRLTASGNAWFQLPELAMGLLPGAGGCVSVSRRIGRQRAALMILSGRRIAAATALAWRLIDAIEDDVAADEGGADPIGGQI